VPAVAEKRFEGGKMCLGNIFNGTSVLEEHAVAVSIQWKQQFLWNSGANLQDHMFKSTVWVFSIMKAWNLILPTGNDCESVKRTVKSKLHVTCYNETAEDCLCALSFLYIVRAQRHRRQVWNGVDQHCQYCIQQTMLWPFNS